MNKKRTKTNGTPKKSRTRRPQNKAKKTTPLPQFKPIAKWDSQESFLPGLIWWSRLDGKYQVEVQGDDANQYVGTLIIFDHSDGDKVIFSQPVSVSFGAMFGVDVADQAAWCDLAANTVDKLNGTDLRHS